MAENKKSFVLYTDWINTIEELDDIDAGILIKHIFRYVNDQSPETENKMVRLVFAQIKQQLKRDLEKYEGKRKQWKEAGEKSAEARRVKKNEQNPTSVEIPSTVSTVNVSDSVNVNASVIIPSINIVASQLDYNKLVEFWLKEFRIGWTFGGQQGKAMKSIIKKIKALKSNSEPIDVFRVICSKLPKWYENKDLQIIDSKFNEIISEIKNSQNGKTDNSKSTGTIEGINRILADKGLLS